MHFVLPIGILLFALPKGRWNKCLTYDACRGLYSYAVFPVSMGIATHFSRTLKPKLLMCASRATPTTKRDGNR